MNNSLSFSAALCALLSAGSLRAESARFYDVEGFGSFLDGNPESTSVSEDGTIRLPILSRLRFEEAAASFGAACSWGDEVVLSRTDTSEVVAIDRAGKSRVITKHGEGVVTAMTVVGDSLYLAKGPEAKLVKLSRGGEEKDVASLEAKYLWQMVEGPRGILFAVTGEPGTVVSIDTTSGKVTKLFEPEQAHMRSVFYDAKLGLFAGGGERGVLYRAPDSRTFKALFDSGHPELTSILARGEHAYVAGVTGAAALLDDADKKAQVRAQMVRVGLDGSAETLAGSSDEAIFSMEFGPDGRILVATGATGRDDPRGRIYAIEPEDRDISMMYQSPSRRITHLLQLPRGAIAAVASGGGRVIHLSGGTAKSGEFFTAPFDTGINSRFGSLKVFGTWPAKTKVLASVRTGQTAIPDDTWSDWSASILAPGGESTKVSNGRYVQIRLTLEGDGKRTPAVHRLRLAYLRQNLPPFVREVVAMKKGIALLPIPRQEQKTKTISLGARPKADDKDGKEQNGAGRARQVEMDGALTVRWLAEDPNGDDLKYELRFRSLGAQDWHQLGDKLDDSFYTLSSAQLADGHYQFQVRASDSPSNPDDTALEDTRESRAVLVDNTPPRVDTIETRTRGGAVTLRIAASDNVGPIVLAEYSLDGQPFRPLSPDDGVVDGVGEAFTLTLKELSPGAHTVTVHLRDDADNDGFGNARFDL